MVETMKFPAWHQHPEKFDPDSHREGILDEAAFLRVADQFISLANQRMKSDQDLRDLIAFLQSATKTP